MSDEQTTPPPALRLKPRLRPADGQTPPGISPPGEPPPFLPVAPASPPAAPAALVVPATPAAPATPATPESPPAKIRFKPRLAEKTDATVAPPPAPAEPAVVNVADPLSAMVPPPAAANPRVTAPAPPLFVTPPPPAPAPPLSVVSPPPASPPAAAAPTEATPAATQAAADAAKFKLKPKLPSLTPPPSSGSGAPPPLFTPPPVSLPPPVFAPPAANVSPPVSPPGKSLPPFPVMAPPAPRMIGGVPLAAATPAAAPVAPVAEFPAPKLPQASRGASPILKVALLLVIAGAGYFGWQQFKPVPAPAAPPPKATPAAKAGGTEQIPTTPITPSETLNQLAHVPANAINKAQEAIATRRASGQARIDAASIGEDLPEPATGAAPAATAKQPATSRASAPMTSTTIAPGVTATAQLDAGAEASPSFRTFVANARVSGVFQGTPSRAVINGRLMRVGEVVDVTLGITFEGVDGERHHLVFKDKSGATVSRRF